MCGIAGILLHEPREPARSSLAIMSRAMEYRGPDDHGEFVAPHIGLVHRRLSIRDLSPAGRCPMSSADNRIQVLLNGEIYNWRELRQELQAHGCSFQSGTDSEVVLHGYDMWGDDVLTRLRGMFAIAVWDGGPKRLLIARDRVGEKPLFYRVTADGLEFASTTEALVLADEDSNVDPDAIACYFAHSFIPATHTAWAQCAVLPPAHAISVEVGGSPQLRRYWRLPQAAPQRRRSPDCLKSTEAVLLDSVARCLDADVPVGVFLSGGVDSSLVAAMASRHRPGLDAFTLGFREQDYSEVEYANKVARQVDLRHHVIEIGPSDLIECLPHLVGQYGQPFGDSSCVPTYLVSRLARRHVTVCLSGDGGDELFGGYWRMQAGIYADRYGRLVPSSLRRTLIPAIASRLGKPGRRWLAINQLSLATNRSSYSNYESWYLRLRELAGPRLASGLGHELVACRAPPLDAEPAWTIVQRILAQDFRVQLPDDFLTKVDTASMAASLEVRAPFLDQKVIEHAWLLPDSMKLRWGQRKWLLKRLAERWVPREVVYREKMGFALPLDTWWRGALGDWLEELLTDSVAGARGWLRPDVALQTLHAHRHGESHHTRLWLALWFELWVRLVETADPTERSARLALTR